jgi:hypothetical protein
VSILTSVKKSLGIAAEQEEFDVDIIMFINSIFVILHHLGIGPNNGFQIQDAVPTWTDYVGSSPLMNIIPTYVSLRVRMLFDPPTTSYLQEAMKNQIDEMEWRISVDRENSLPPEVTTP